MLRNYLPLFLNNDGPRRLGMAIAALSLAMGPAAQAHPLVHIMHAAGHAVAHAGAKLMGGASAASKTVGTAATQSAKAAGTAATKSGAASKSVAGTSSGLVRSVALDTAVSSAFHGGSKALASRAPQAAAGAARSAGSSAIDDAANAAWRHRGKIAAATALGAVAVHADALAESAGENVAKPLITGTIEHVAKPVVSPLAKLFAFALGGLGVWLAVKTRVTRKLVRTLKHHFWPRVMNYPLKK
ncbi:hypothetical protein KOR34_00650 [Posidoniimonas corsicana]|uniref:Uncharacterized protein n=1 Tax=Posidoniimonas corsicana TaxID=1938618 RepID=A0A5C5VB43_9BACT|nr:hypothetical protein [Posidoniimonas corsicana]TWT35177.1 hypothetical protein KOR34_00650 [Posidoniimonas corsicana]